MNPLKSYLILGMPFRFDSPPILWFQTFLIIVKYRKILDIDLSILFLIILFTFWCFPEPVHLVSSLVPPRVPPPNSL